MGEPYPSRFRIALGTRPCEEPVVSNEVEGELQISSSPGIKGSKKTVSAPMLGDTRLCRPDLHRPTHEALPVPDPSRRIASTDAMRSPIQHITGTTIELPRAL
jgi:hypothetical protein